MRSILFASLTLCAAAGLALACGGNAPEPTAPTAGGDGGSSAAADTAGDAAAPTTSSSSGATASASGGAAPPVADAPADFDKLSKDKKVEIMMTKVVPDVGKIFKDHDGKKFAKFGCKTCHGDAKDKSKEDPHKVLPKLTFSNGGYAKLEKSKPAMMKFMNEQVLPAMATALGEKVADKDGKNGATCGDCHTVN